MRLLAPLEASRPGLRDPAMSGLTLGEVGGHAVDLPLAWGMAVSGDAQDHRAREASVGCVDVSS